jgi:hypothetical protein
MLTILKQFNTQRSWGNILNDLWPSKREIGETEKTGCFLCKLLQSSASSAYHIWLFIPFSCGIPSMTHLGARNDYSEILKLPSTLLGGLSLLYEDVGVACMLSVSLLLVVVSCVQLPVSLTMWQEKPTQFLPFFSFLLPVAVCGGELCRMFISISSKLIIPSEKELECS